MAIKLNLLPPEKAVSAPVGKILKTLKNVNIIVISAFILFVIGIGGAFFFYRVQLQKVTANVENLKTQIKSSQTKEQQIVLVKDRLAKIRKAKNAPNVYEELEKVQPFLDIMGADARLTELDINSQKVDLTILFSTTSGLANFLQAIRQTKDFKTVVLTSFGYNPAGGYLVSFNLN